MKNKWIFLGIVLALASGVVLSQNYTSNTAGTDVEALSLQKIGYKLQSGTLNVAVQPSTSPSLTIQTFDSISNLNATATIAALSANVMPSCYSLTLVGYHGNKIVNSGRVWILTANNAGAAGLPLETGGSVTITAVNGRPLNVSSFWFSNEVAGDGFLGTAMK